MVIAIFETAVSQSTAVSSWTDHLKTILFGPSPFLTFFLGIAVAILLFYLARKTKKPGYVMKTIAVLNENSAKAIKEIDIKVLGAPVTNLALTKIAFWNAGREVINKSDLAKDLTITAKGSAKILSWGVLYRTDQNNNIRDTPVGNGGKLRISVDFEYLDKDAGFIVLVVHTGSRNDDLVVEGKIKGVNKLWRLPFPATRATPLDYPFRLMNIIWYAVFFAALAIGFFVSRPDSDKILEFDITRFVLLSAVAPFVMATIVMIAITLALSPVWSVPKRMRESWREF